MKTLGPYTLTHHLGTGGMGEVWIGHRSVMGGATKSVAIKTLLAQRAHHSKFRKMFLDEARLSMLMTNSNIVQVFDAGEADDGTCYMAMEWVDGISLASLFELSLAENEAVPTTIIAFIIGEVLKALAYAHHLERRGERLTIVHRDVSPQNVMLSIAGEVKLMDFGIARVASEDSSGEHLIKGKLRYMPPEQLRGESRDPSIDLFAVGAILHELLDGKQFRHEDDPVRLYGMVFAGEVPPLSCPPGTIPTELEALRVGLLAAKPEDRIPSARAAYRKLTEWPGYRDAKFELEDLVRRGKRAEGTATALRPARPASKAPPADTAATLVERGGSKPPAQHPAKFIGLGLAILSLSFGLFGIGTVLNWWGDDQPQLSAPSEKPTGPSR